MTLEIFFVIYESKDSKVWSAIESIAIQRCLRFHHKPQQLNPLQSTLFKDAPKPTIIANVIQMFRNMKIIVFNIIFVWNSVSF